MTATEIARKKQRCTAAIRAARSLIADMEAEIRQLEHKPEPEARVLTFDQLGMTPAGLRSMLSMSSIRESGLVRALINWDGREGIEAGFYAVVATECDCRREGFDDTTFTLRHLTEQQYWKGEEQPWRKGHVKIEAGLLVSDQDGREWIVDDLPAVIVKAQIS